MEAPVVLTGFVLIVAMLLRQMVEASDLARRERQLRTLADQLSADLGSAAKYVASILPGELEGPVQVSNRYLPSQALGGDSFGYYWIDEDHLMVYLIDVSGHGVEPALLSVSVHNMLRSGSLPLEILLAPDRVLLELNEKFDMHDHDDHYFTMWYGVYQASTRRLCFAGAGHPPALALTEDHGAVSSTELDGKSLPVGMFRDSTFPSDTYLVPHGARILLYSDGVLGDRLPFADFVHTCTELAATPDWSLDALIESLRVNAGGSFDDDCALVQLTF